jgi:hypothetical protein
MWVRFQSALTGIDTGALAALREIEKNLAAS